MAVYTKVSGDEITEFLKSYHIGDFISLHEIAEGIENTNYLLKTQNGNFILTLYEKRVNVDELPFFMNLTSHLSESGLPVPKAIPNKHGNPLSDLCERKAAIIEFLQGRDLKILTDNTCFQAGEMLAKLHLKGLNFDQQRTNSMGQHTWQDLYEQCDADETRAFNSLVPDMVQGELKHLQTAWPNHLPKGIVHADFFPDNVFFDEDTTLSGVIDFYFACTDILAYDLAIAINAWCFEDFTQMNTKKANAMIAGYQSIRPLSDEEKATMPTLLRGGAMRFLLSRLYDWVNTPADALVQRKGPTEYIQKLQFHRSNPTVKDYGLHL